MTKPSKVTTSQGVDAWLQGAKDSKAEQDKFKKVRKAIKNMREIGPSYPGFHTHKMKTLTDEAGRPLWNSYLENKTPSAWRMYWVYRDDGEIHITSVGPHDHDPTGPSG